MSKRVAIMLKCLFESVYELTFISFNTHPFFSTVAGIERRHHVTGRCDLLYCCPPVRVVTVGSETNTMSTFPNRNIFIEHSKTLQEEPNVLRRQEMLNCLKNSSVND